MSGNRPRFLNRSRIPVQATGAASARLRILLVYALTQPESRPLCHDFFRAFGDLFYRANHEVRVFLHDPVIAVSR